jgi:hypothetical protein
MDALRLLLERCKCGVYLHVNEHRDDYETATGKLAYLQLESPPEISDDVREGIIRTDTIVDLQFYPDTPIGFYKIVHYDVEEALRLALKKLGLCQPPPVNHPAHPALASGCRR